MNVKPNIIHQIKLGAIMFQVSIMAMEESRVLVWHRDKLKLSIISDAFLQAVFDHILGRDVVHKLMQVSCLALTFSHLFFVFIVLRMQELINLLTVLYLCINLWRRVRSGPGSQGLWVWFPIGRMIFFLFSGSRLRQNVVCDFCQYAIYWIWAERGEWSVLSLRAICLPIYEIKREADIE